MVSIPKKVTERFVKTVGNFQKILKQAKDRDINEADTVTIVSDMLADVFGFDKYVEVTGEHAIKGTYCDLAIKIDNSIKYLIEVKAIGLNLKENHLRQAINYGANNGIEWTVLTNGIDWEVHRIHFERPIEHEQVCSFNFLELNPRKEDDQQMLFILCKEGLSKDAIEHFHEHVQSVNRFIIAATVLGDAVVDKIRKELRRMSPGAKADNDEIRGILESEVLKRDVVEGDPAREAKARVKKAERKLHRQRSKKSEEETEEAEETEAQEE